MRVSQLPYVRPVSVALPVSVLCLQKSKVLYHSLGTRHTTMCREKVGGPRIPEFFSRNVVSLVTAKGMPMRLNSIGGQWNRL